VKGKALQGLSGHLKEKLIQQSLERRARRLGQESQSVPRPNADAGLAPGAAAIPDRFCRFDLHPGYQQLRLIKESARQLGIPDPYLRSHEGIAGETSRIEGRAYANFSSYNYLGLSGDPRVAAAAKAAIERYGTSVSASRVVSGERPLHRELERELAAAYGVDDCVVFVSGHATNVTAIGYLFGPKDLVVHDSMIHNSALQGIQLSGARRMPFPHNDWAALDRLLATHRRSFERTLIVVEGIYSMDGDFPDLPRFVEIKQRHRAFLMVDEAHSFGVMGRRGLGIREHFGLDGRAVDIWMGTLSKALASCGGYIAGESALIEHLKLAAPGFLYSVGMAPPVAAAALAALQCLRGEPERVERLHARARLLLDTAAGLGIDTGASAGIGIVPAIVGSSIKAARLANALFEQGINVQPILYPAVEEKTARLRFFVSSEHTEEQIRQASAAMAAALLKL
jgi:8-amino-7-oxononanoate synthase